MNNDAIKVQKIKSYTMLIGDIQDLIYKYNKLLNDDKMSETAHETAQELLMMFKNELINFISLTVED